jgi:DNA-binding NarL/FixJ family response regulator
VRARLLLADDHVLLLEALGRLLEPEFDVVGTVTDGARLVEEAVRLQPNVVVTDVSMPRMGGFEAVRRLRDEAPSVRVVFLTMSDDPRVAAEAFRMGASAWVLKSSSGDELRRAIRAALIGKRHLASGILGGHIDRLPAPRLPPSGVDDLTPREREVLILLAEGKPMKQAADVLGITPRTVAFHKYRIMAALGIKSSAELVRFAVQNRLV